MVELKEVRRKLGPGVEFFCESFCAGEGSQVALWGPSGCGKSTMLNLISGLLRPSSGVITIDGIETQRLRSGQLDRLRPFPIAGGKHLADGEGTFRSDAFVLRRGPGSSRSFDPRSTICP